MDASIAGRAAMHIGVRCGEFISFERNIVKLARSFATSIEREIECETSASDEMNRQMAFDNFFAGPGPRLVLTPDEMQRRKTPNAQQSICVWRSGKGKKIG